MDFQDELKCPNCDVDRPFFGDYPGDYDSDWRQQFEVWLHCESCGTRFGVEFKVATKHYIDGARLISNDN